MDKTFLILFAAYLLAEFPLRPAWNAGKGRVQPLPLLLHLVVVAVVTTALLGAWQPWIVGTILVLHLLLDAVHTPEKSLTHFALEQAAQIVVLAGLAWLFPTAFDTGWGSVFGAQASDYLAAIAFVAGLVVNLQVGGSVIGSATQQFRTQLPSDLIVGLSNGSLYIGWLERALVMLFILIDQPAGVGFVITAKSILRFSDAQDLEHRKASEYIIIGTFMSFGWGLVVSLLTHWTIRHYLP